MLHRDTARRLKQAGVLVSDVGLVARRCSTCHTLFWTSAYNDFRTCPPCEGHVEVSKPYRTLRDGTREET